MSDQHNESRPSRIPRVLRTVVRFSVASATHSVATMVGSLVVLRWVSPEELGVWHSLLLVQTYVAFLQAGVFNGLARELPFRLGARDPRASELLATGQAVAGWIAIALLVFAAGAFLAAADPMVRFVLPAVLLCTAGTLYEQLVAVTYRANQAFETLAKIRLIQSVGTLASLPLVYWLGYAGLPLRFGVVTVIGVVLMHLWRPIRVRTAFQRRHLVTLLKVGVPIFVFAYLMSVAGTFPRLLLLTVRGTTEVGLFAPAAAVLALFVLLPRSIGQYVGPQLSHRLGRTGDPRAMWALAWKSSVSVLAISAPVALVAFLILPEVVAWAFPKYILSVPAVRWILIAGVFLGAAMSKGAVKSAKAWGWMATLTGCRVSLSYLIPFGLLHVMSNSLEAVALGFAIAQAVSFGVDMMAAYVVTHSPRYRTAVKLELEQGD